MTRRYAELVCASNFSFLRGASHPEELVLTARALGLAALAIADRNSLAGVVRGHRAARDSGQRVLVASRLVLRDGTELVALPEDRAAYGRLSRLLSLGKGRAAKGNCELGLDDVLAHRDGLLLILLPPADWRPGDGLPALDALGAARRRLWLGASPRHDGRDRARLEALAAAAAAARLPLVAVGDVLYHGPGRRRLADVLTCIREHCTIDQAGFRLAANAERFLKDGAEMARLFAAHPAALDETLAIAERARFSLADLAYEYPADPLPPGLTAQQQLARLTEAGLAWRYPEGAPAKVRATVDHELALIERLGYAPYFLTVHDLIRFAGERGILAQGRGSAANSAVCYCLGITAVDPGRIDLLFERFVSAARDEPPDIDVDFEHERREEVIQYVYGKYGRERAALAATVITYRSRSALREVAKAMGLSLDTAGALSGALWSRGQGTIDRERIRELGLDPEAPRLALAIDLAEELIGFPRHLSQHVGGFVITRQALTEIVPVGWAAMADRSFVEWDKDDLDALGILKIDVLALGMLSCLARCLALLRQHHGREETLASIPEGDEATYDMLSRADSIGVFQVESRAQMSMLPRLRPRNFYDLVIEVAIVRPGPIQGDMVHPYLRRRQGLEAVDYPSPALKAVLEKTQGVPLFQEQAMKIAIAAAGFTPEEADGLRRAMATFRHLGVIHKYRDKMIGGMIARGYTEDFARRCFRQIEGFGTYGFPESHAASFALLVYVSAWLKCHYPAVFAAGLLNSQPMGFYAPAQLVRDARSHGVAVRPVEVTASAWDCTLEADRPGRPALRLGLRQIKGLSTAAAARLLAARAAAPFRDLRDFAERTVLDRTALDVLAEADAFRGLGLDRRRALWTLDGLDGAAKAGLAPADTLPLFAAAARGRNLLPDEPEATLAEMPLGAHVIADYARLRLSLKAHPVGFLRSDLAAAGSVPCAALARLRPGRRVTVSGLVLIRQRPGSAKGTIFVTLEDETGIANLIVWPGVFETCRKAVLGARLLTARGRLQAESGVVHVVAEWLQDDSRRLGQLAHRDGDRLDPAEGDGAEGGGAYVPKSRDFK